MIMNTDLVICDPGVMLGKPCVRGTRITVELVLEKLGAGESVDQILAAHPRLSRDGIQAAVNYALGVMRSDIVLPVTKDVA